MSGRPRGLPVLVLASVLACTGCEEIGNPLPGTGRGEGQLVRESPSSVGPLVIEARYVDPTQLHDLLQALGDEVDHVDRAVPRGGAVVVLMVRPRSPLALPPTLHLVSDFRYENGTGERRVWVAHTTRPRFIAIFGLKAVPIDVGTTTL